MGEKTEGPQKRQKPVASKLISSRSLKRNPEYSSEEAVASKGRGGESAELPLGNKTESRKSGSEAH